MVEQNLFVCIILAAVGGFLSVAARAVVLCHARKRKQQYAQRQQQQQQQQLTREESSKIDVIKLQQASEELPAVVFSTLSSSLSTSATSRSSTLNCIRGQTTTKTPTELTTQSFHGSTDDKMEESNTTGGPIKEKIVLDKKKQKIVSDTNHSAVDQKKDRVQCDDYDHDVESTCPFDVCQGQHKGYQMDDDNVNSKISRQDKEAKRQNETCAMLAKYLGLCVVLKPIQFFAPWFGPVSIYWPVYVGSRMVSNLFVVGTCMGHEKFAKPAQVATMVVVSAVIYIAISGPAVGTSASSQTEDPKDFIDLLSGNWISIVWLLLLGAIFAVSSLVIMICLVVPIDTINSTHNQLLTKMLSPFMVEAFIFLNAITTSTLSATTSRGASTLDNADQATTKIVLMALSWYLYLWWMVESFMEGRFVRSLKLFVPTETLGSVLLNGITGLIVWDDASVIVSWVGYMTAIALLALGVYLFSDLDFFKVQMDDEQEYLRGHRQAEEDDWHDLFASIHQCLTQAQVEQELMPHQRTMIRHSNTTVGNHVGEDSLCDSRPPLEKMFSDPEVGTRSQQIGVVYVEEAKKHGDESTSSLHLHDDLSLFATPELAKIPFNGSATSQALVSLERLMSSHRTIWESSHGSIQSDEMTTVTTRSAMTLSPMRQRQRSVTSTGIGTVNCKSISRINSLDSLSLQGMVDNDNKLPDDDRSYGNTAQSSIVINPTMTGQTISPLPTSSPVKKVSNVLSAKMMNVLATQLEKIADDMENSSCDDEKDDDDSTVDA